MSPIEQAAASAAVQAARPSRADRQRWAWISGTVLAAVVLMFCYLRISGATQVTSDGAGLVLEAQSMLHGNVLLHGWWASDVTFYTTELPEYALVTFFAGLRPEVVHICSALTYTLLVLLAAYVARGRARGAVGVVRALLAAGVILVPQPTGPTQVLLGGPDHVGSAVPVLVLLLLLDWARPRWWVPVAAGILLAWGIVGDQLIELAGAVPLCLACLLRAVRLMRPWSRARSWTAGWYDLSLAAAAAAAVPAGLAASRLLVRWGGIQPGPVSYHLALQQNMTPQAWGLAGRCLLALYGADFVPADFNGTSNAGSVAFAAAHLLGVALVIAAVLLALWRLARPRRDPAQGAAPGTPAPGRAGDLVANVLLLGMLVNFAAFMIEVHIDAIYSAHEIGPLLGLGAALTGRMLGGPLVAGWRAAGGRLADGRPDVTDGRPPAYRRVPLKLLAAFLAAGLAAYVVLLGVAAGTNQGAPRNAALAAWLVRHHLRDGLAPYWQGSSVTVDSHGQTELLPVKKAALLANQVVPDAEESDLRLVDAKGAYASFVVCAANEDITAEAVSGSFGQPAATYRYQNFTILVWHKNLLPALSRSAAAEARLEGANATIPL